MTISAVVLAGGASRRFGSDKLEVRLGSHRLIEHAVRGLPAGVRLVIVGPARDDLAFDPPARYTREDPPGGGPAAALVAGLSAVAGDDDVIVVLPGDAPAAGEAASVLLQSLLADPGRLAVVGVGADGREQPLQLALRREAARRLIRAAGPEAGQGASARALVHAALGGHLHRVRLDEHLSADIDTREDAARWRAAHPV